MVATGARRKDFCRRRENDDGDNAVLSAPGVSAGLVRSGKKSDQRRYGIDYTS